MKVKIISLFLSIIVHVSFGACPASQTKPSPFPSASAGTMAFTSGSAATSTSGLMPSTAGSYKLPSANHTINSGDINVDVEIYVQNGQTLTMGYTYNVNGGKLFNVYVDAGGVFKFNTGQFKGSKLFIWGFLIVGQDTEVQASTGFYLGSGGVFSAPGYRVTLPSSAGQFLVDGGTIDTKELYINNLSTAGDALCIKNSGCVKTGGFANNDEGNAISSPDGTGSIWMNGTTMGNINATLLNPTSAPTICTNLSSVDFNRWCGGNTAACTTKITTNCSGAPATKCNNPLPIQLDYFVAKKSPEGIGLFWATLKQQNSSFFIIERSKDGIHWESIGTVDARGSSERYNSYHLLDQDPLGGQNYYRLSEVDGYGTKQIYSIAYIKSDPKEIAFYVFPNPSNGTFTVRLGNEYDQYNLDIIDMRGSTLGSYVLHAGENLLALEVGAGMYIAKLKIGSDYKMEKLVVK